MCNYTIRDISNHSLSQIGYRKKKNTCLAACSQLPLETSQPSQAFVTHTLQQSKLSEYSSPRCRMQLQDSFYSSSPMQRECHSEHHADPLSTFWDGLGMRLDGGLTWECDWLSSKGQKQAQSQPKLPALPDIISVVYPQEHWALFSRGGAEKLASEYNIPLLGTIPLDPVRCGLIYYLHPSPFSQKCLCLC